MKILRKRKMIRLLYYKVKNCFYEVRAYVWLYSLWNLTIHHDIPYISQFASPDLVESFFERENNSSTDPLRAETGAESREQYAHRSWSVCGMACLAMILALQWKYVWTIALAHEALKNWVYKEDETSLSWMIYTPFLTYIQQVYWMKWHIYQYSSIRLLAYLVAQWWRCMISVHPSIRYANEKYHLRKQGILFS